MNDNKRAGSVFENIINDFRAISDGVYDEISNLANAASILYNALDNINWAGFYILKGDTLMLGPFMGRPACTAIPNGKGVCGTAWAMKETQVVPDVDQFPGHIACSSASRSEIVVPVIVDDEVKAVLDIDSDQLSTFDDVDKLYLEKLVEVMSKTLYK